MTMGIRRMRTYSREGETMERDVDVIDQGRDVEEDVVDRDVVMRTWLVVERGGSAGSFARGKNIPSDLLEISPGCFFRHP